MPSLCVSELFFHNPNGLRLSKTNIPKTANVSWALGTPNDSSPCRPHLHDRGASGAQQAAAETTVVPPPEGVEGLTAAFFRMDGMGDLKWVSHNMLGFKLPQFPRISRSSGLATLLAALRSLIGHPAAALAQAGSVKGCGTHGIEHRSAQVG